MFTLQNKLFQNQTDWEISNNSLKSIENNMTSKQSNITNIYFTRVHKICEESLPSFYTGSWKQFSELYLETINLTIYKKVEIGKPRNIVK